MVVHLVSDPLRILILCRHKFKNNKNIHEDQDKKALQGQMMECEHTSSVTVSTYNCSTYVYKMNTNAHKAQNFH